MIFLSLSCISGFGTGVLWGTLEISAIAVTSTRTAYSYRLNGVRKVFSICQDFSGTKSCQTPYLFYFNVCRMTRCDWWGVGLLVWLWLSGKMGRAMGDVASFLVFWGGASCARGVGWRIQSLGISYTWKLNVDMGSQTIWVLSTYLSSSFKDTKVSIVE